MKHFNSKHMNYNYKLDENISKTLIKRNMLASNPNKKKTYHVL